MSTPPLVLHSSLWRLCLQAMTPLFLLGLGATGLVRGGGLLPIAILTVGLAVTLVVLFDLPVRSEFTAAGVTRICPLRRQHLSWSEVVAVERLGTLSTRASHDDRDRAGKGGLAARTLRRRVHLLVDRRESRAEFEVLRQLLDDRRTQLRAGQPPVDAAPAGRGRRALHRRQSS